MKKKLTALMLALLLCTASVLPVHADTSANTVLGDVLNTDIVTYIDGFPIRSYNINWDTYIVVEDLMQYGFGVTWDGDARRLVISRTRTCAPEYYSASYIPTSNNAANGTVAANYYATDIVTVIGELPVESYNIGGFTCIKIDTVAAEFGMAYAWDGEARTVSLTSQGNENHTVQPEDTTVITVPEDIPEDQATEYVYSELFKKIAETRIDGFLSSLGDIRDPDYALGFVNESFSFEDEEVAELAALAFSNAFTDYSYGIKYSEVNGNTVTTVVEISMRKLDDAFTNAALALMYVAAESDIEPTEEEMQLLLYTFVCLEIADESREVVTNTVSVDMVIDLETQTAEMSETAAQELFNAVLGGLYNDPIFSAAIEGIL